MKMASKLCLFLITFLSTIAINAQCDNSAVAYPRKASSKSFVGSSFEFLNPNNIFPASSSFASATALLTLLSGKSELLEAKDFGFQLPSNAIVCGIETKIRESAEGINILSVVTDDKVQLLSNGVLSGSNLKKSDWWQYTAQTKSYGGTSTLWGKNWSPQEINSPEFGVAISVQMNGLLSLLPTAKIHSVEMTIHYTVQAILPVKISDFGITSPIDVPTIYWKLNDIPSNLTVTVERSANSAAWAPVYTKNYGQQLNENSSSFTDQLPLPATGFYRIKLTGPNGIAIYSKVVAYEGRTDPDHFVISPNPATNYILLTGKNIGNVAVYDNYGRPVLKKIFSNCNACQLNLENLSKGIYIIKTDKYSRKFVKH